MSPPQPFSLKLAGFALTALLSSGCASTLAPQVGRTIPIAKMLNQGAMLDASRAYRVAFYADPTQQPDFVEVSAGLGGTKVLTSQWSTELARILNVVVGKVSRYDERFMDFAAEVFSHDIDNGDINFKYRPPAGGPKFGKARVVTIRLTEVKTSSGNEGIVGHAMIEVALAGWIHMYACEAAGQSDWMARTMACLGEHIVGDPSFWKAVEAAP